MDNENENNHGDVDIGAWNKMCTTVCDVRTIFRAPPFLLLYAHVLTLDRCCKQLEDYLYSVGIGRRVR
jgi:hypothetical protein